MMGQELTMVTLLEASRSMWLMDAPSACLHDLLNGKNIKCFMSFLVCIKDQ